MSERKIKFGLVPADKIREQYYDIYHNSVFNNQKDFDYNKLKDGSLAKLLEDATRTAFFTGFHKAEDMYEIREIMELLNKDE